MSRPPRVLIVRLGALGDVVLGLPALRLLRRSLPEAGIGWLVEERHAAVLAGNPELNACFIASTDRWRREPLARRTRRELWRLLGELRRERFDLAIDLQGLWKSALLARLSGARRVLGLARGQLREPGSGILLGRQAPAPPGSAHVTDLYLETAREAVRLLGGVPAEADEERLIVLSEAERATAGAQLERSGMSEFVILNPGAAWPTKQWPPERFGALARALVDGLTGHVFVAVGPGEEGLAQRVLAAASSPRVVSFPTGVRELAALAARAQLFIGGDTGPYHLARAVGTPTIGLFGPTDPARNGARGPSDRVVWGKPACSPCYGRSCPTAIECMASIEVSRVLQAAQDLLGRS